MGFVGIYRAAYDYAPQAEGELLISEHDILFVLEKDDGDQWWKAKKKAAAEDDEEPTGLVPSNYLEEAIPIGSARALYDYTRQTEEELSFPEDVMLSVFDTSDPDWILVGLGGDYGFVPANYIEMADADAHDTQPSPPLPPPTLPARPPVEKPAPVADPLRGEATSPHAPLSSPTMTSGPTAALAAALTSGAAAKKPSVSFAEPSPPAPSNENYSARDLEVPSTGDEEREVEHPASPPLPSRTVPRLEPKDYHSRKKSPPIPIRAASGRDFDTINSTPLSPGGFRLYHINEMVSLMGKRKKMPTTLGINLATGVILIAPEHSQDGPTQEWTGDRMTHYSREGKHVFLELVKPSKSIDFHAGSKDTAEEILGALGELAGAIRAEGLLDIISAGQDRGQKAGVVLYDFVAQGEDEVSVRVGDDVLILDDRLSEEWWKVRCLRTKADGVVPSTYIDVSRTLPSASSASSQGRSTVEQNRIEEKRLAREAVKSAADSEREDRISSTSPEAKSKPDPAKVRTWTDRSKSFSVEAQFLGLKDDKINLHKMNGVKIAVPLAKMSGEDLKYVERLTGKSLQPKSGRERGEGRDMSAKPANSSSHGKVGASLEPRKPEYDWFQFFLSCDVAVGLCDRYAQAFIKDSIDETVLPDVDATVLRNLGLREGDIIKVMRHLDFKFNRPKVRKDHEAEGGGLFTGEGGKLKNNTRKARPEPTTQAGDVIDGKIYVQEQQLEKQSKMDPSAAQSSAGEGFDDDAWDVKPSRVQAAAAPARQSSPGSEKPATTTSATTQHSTESGAAPPLQRSEGMQELSLLSEPLRPTRPSPTSAPSQAVPGLTSQSSQTPGASPAVFDAVAALKSSPPVQAGVGGPAPSFSTPTQGLVAAQPPARPLSAPQVTAGPGHLGAATLLPQMTGLQGQVAPPGQSLGDLVFRQQDQFRQMQQQQQQPSPGGVLMPHPTGIMGPQMTAIQGSYNHAMIGPRLDASSGFQPQPTGIPGQVTVSGPVNSFLPNPLEPQRLPVQEQQQQQPMLPGTQPSSAGVLGQFSSGQGQQLQPLSAQKTGPAPPIRFGMPNNPKRLVPQATARRANLAHATPDNPFGF